jgi:hypothetical protein
MSFAQSPYPEVVNLGLRIERIRTQLLLAGWDMTTLDTSLKALRDDNGGVPLPNGATETASVMRAVFELRPQIMRQAHSLYEREYKKLAPTQPAAPPQTATFEFTADLFFFDHGFQNGAQNIPVRVLTDDLQPLAVETEIDAIDVGTGTCPTPGGYTFASPQTLIFPAGVAHNSTQNAVIEIVAFGSTGTVDLQLDNGDTTTVDIQAGAN